MKLIVGLGNPGPDYEMTRHNLGFLVVRALADAFRWRWRKSRLCHGYLSEGETGGEKAVLLLPMTYMNRSGRAVRACLGRKKVGRPDLLVVCDDFHLDFGRLRIRPSGSDGGHNGLNDVILALGAKDFGRLRVGIGSPPDNRDAVDYVLSEFRSAEKKQLDRVIEDAAACCVTWLSEGMAKAMNAFNKS